MIPIFKPKLPCTDQLLNLLKEIDRTHIYSNFGPLNGVLVEHIANHFNLESDCVTTVNNATSGLTLALLSLRSNKKYCLVPSWTFSATALAVISAGFTPYLMDVDSETHQLDPDSVLSTLTMLEGNVAAIVPVQPFGAPIDIESWNNLFHSTKVPIIFDSAAGFDSIRPSNLVSVVSMHATKLLPSGEGGFVISKNKKIISEIKQRSNFGFTTSRETNLIGFNAKLSEYHAAIGIASLANFHNTRSDYLNLAKIYSKELNSNVAKIEKGFGIDWISTSLTIELLNDSAKNYAQYLNKNNIDTRMWYCNGLHKQKAYTEIPRVKNLDVTDHLGKMTLGIPFFQGLDSDSIKHISTLINKF